MTKSLAAVLMTASLVLAACAPSPTPTPITDQSFGGKVGASGGTVGLGFAARGCPDFAGTMYRGDLYCIKGR